MSDLIIALKEHSYFGYLFAAYFTKAKNEHFIEIIETVSFLHSNDQKESLSEEEQMLIQTIDSYSDQNLAKIFAKKKKTQIFLKELKPLDIEKRIRPFIEKRLYTILEKLIDKDIDIYLKNDDFTTFHEDDRLTLLKKPAQTIFNIIRHNEGTKYYLSVKHNDKSIHLKGKKHIVISREPCSLVLDNEIFLFNDIDAKKLLPFFDKSHIEIPKSAEKKWFKAFAVNAIKKYEVNAQGFTVKEKEYSGKAVLKLQKNWQSDYVFILNFLYGNDIYSAGKKVETKLDFDESDFEFIKSKRNEEWEMTIIQALLKIGFVEQADNSYKVSLNLDQEKQYIETIHWLSEHKGKISEAGIEFVQDLFKKKYAIEKINAEIRSKQEKDWFDIYGSVLFGDVKIPFIQLKNNIINNDPEFILPDGRIALIPEEWFSKYNDLFLFGKEHENTLRLNKANFQAFEKTDLIEIDNKFKKNLKKLLHYNSFEIELPKKINAELRPYQKEGLKWLSFLQENGFGGCLADDMGLGKTLQTIALLLKTTEKRKANTDGSDKSIQSSMQMNLFADVGQSYEKKASLIIMPVSLIHNWKNEIKKFAPDLSFFVYQGNNRHRHISLFHEYDIILSGYALIRNDIELLKKLEFLYIILDESQFIKNPDSKIYKAVNELSSDYKLLLTGTPIENSLQDLWAQLNFLNDGMLGNRRFFNQSFITPVEKKNDEAQEEKLKQLISPFILRRTKDEVAQDLPPLTEQIIYCIQEDEQKSFYEREKSKVRNRIIELIDSGIKKSLSVEVLGALTKLRQISNHPLMVDQSYEGKSGKFEEIIRNLENILNGDHKVLIFSSFVKHLDLLAETFNGMKLKYSMLTGQTKDREAVINQFQNDPENKVFLISIKAGGTGLNLTEADYVFIIDPWWNPAVEKQAVNRAHRIGQDKKVMVYRYISKDTIEEKIAKLQEKKTELAETFINNNNPLSELSESKILDLFS